MTMMLSLAPLAWPWQNACKPPRLLRGLVQLRHVLEVDLVIVPLIPLFLRHVVIVLPLPHVRDRVMACLERRLVPLHLRR